MTFKSKVKTLSVAINNEYIKMCELTRAGKTITIHKTVTVPMPERTYNDGIIRDRGTLAKIIKVAVDDNRIMTTNVIFTIASTKIATKEVIIPNVKANRIEDIVNTNATEYFPVNIKEYLIQHTVLERMINDENKIKVLVMAAPSEMIDDYYDLASSLGWNIQAIDYVGNSIYQALRLQIDTAPSIVIQIENDTTIINIFDHNVLQLQRTIPYGKSVVVNAVMEEKNLKYDKALKLLQTEQLVHDSFDGDEITESFKYLINNVNRVVDYYVTRNADKPIEKAYVIGNATTILGVQQLFSHALNVPLTSIDKLKGVVCDKKNYVDETELTSYITSIGAAVAPVNFIPVSVLNKEKSKDDSKSMHTILAAAIIASIALVIVPAVMMLSAKLERDNVQEKVDKIKNVENIVNDYYEAKDIASDALTFKNLTLGNNDTLSLFITGLEAQMPSDISIKTMTADDGAVTITGVTSSKESLALFIQNLKKIDGVSNVLVANETEAKDGTDLITATFSLTCTFTTAR